MEVKFLKVIARFSLEAGFMVFSMLEIYNK